MAKGQMRSNKEVRKPKADKKAKAGTTGSDAGKATSAFKAVDDKKKG